MDCDIASYHVDSFNFLTDVGIQAAAIDIPPVKVRIGDEIVEFSYGAARVGRPSLSAAKHVETSEGAKLYPAECRQRALTYSAPLKVWIDLKVDGARLGYVECVAGEIPIMLRSKACNLYGLSAEELVKRGEEAIEKGGYFICKGSEKVMRLLVANKRNFPLALERPGLREKGRLFSPYAVMMRSVCGNHRAAVINVHYLESACIVLSIQFEREIFYVPLMYVLKCLTSISDRAIFEHMTRGRPGDGFWAGCVTNMLSMAQNEGVKTSQDAFIALGSRFRVVLENRFGKWESDTNMTRHLLKTCVCIHLDTDEQKFHCLVLMSQKLIALVKNEIQPESLDNPQFQEASVSGHILLLIIRERLERMLLISRRRLEIAYSRAPNTFSLTTESFTKAYLTTRGEITNGLEYFLATGNLVTQNGLGLMQKTGFSIIAERINQLRFVSHFRALHRGAFFMEMRTTDVRKLRPEAWGFICPVHTPDGAPCGLLNHVTASCRIVTHYPKTDKLRALLTTVGVVPHVTTRIIADDQPSYPVIVDGDFFGYVPRSKAPLIERYLRQLKVDSKDTRVPYITEIALIRASNPAMVMTQFPGFYIYTGPGRFIRPVRNMASRSTEFIGIFEQVYLSVVVDPDEAELNVTMHQELHPSALFSFAGSLIPFPDHNQSPRNVYQCQMGKQTMGVPVHAWRTRADGKMYLIQTPQDPLIKLEAYDKYEMSDYPLGTHACVAVISYTGYDMEDAMVINKSSYQRGLAHGSVIKVERIDLAEKRGFMKTCDKVFFTDPKDPPASIGADGLPIPGRMYHKDDIYYSVFDRATGTFDTHKFKYTEAAWCGMVRIVYDDDLKEGKSHALVQWRFARNPIIGDKFASRHGQKGINSFLWPSESLPFAESGMVPDIVFNPHGFPSRMTIGMMIESMAGKAACMHGEHYDASPFIYNEKNTAISHFGDLLSKAGYNYMGNETMYSGVDGSMMEVQIFFGVVYYQRLRHMIADKFQVRSTGSVDPVTLQPIKGRKVGGGIRFGEMERDALIAHGTAFCLQDRLFNCSDKDEAYVCATCGSIVSVTKLCKKKADEEAALHYSQRKKLEPGTKLDYEHILGDGEQLSEGARFAADALNVPLNDPESRSDMERKQRIQARNFASRHCTICQRVDNVYLTQIPRVFRYLCAELSAMNVRIRLEVAHPKDVFRS